MGQPLCQCAMQSNEKERISISAASLVILIAFWEKDFLWAAPSLCRVDKRIPCTCWINNTFFWSMLYYIYHILYNTACYIHHNYIFWIKGAPIYGYVGSVKQACAEIKRNCFSQPYFVIARNKTFLLHRFPDHWRNWTLSFIGFPRYWKYTGCL